MHWGCAIEISNHRTYCVTHQTMFSSYAISVVQNNLLPVSQIFLTSAQDITELQNSFSEILNILVELTLGPLDASSQSWCLDNLSSQEKVELINLLRSLKFWVHQLKNKSKLWTQTIKNIDSHKLDHFHGKKFSDIELQKKPSISFHNYYNTTH